MKSIVTRFRAYQLCSAGAAFSYFADGHFTIMEGRLTDTSFPMLVEEMKLCNVALADTLHITSWDNDHCSSSELPRLLEIARPKRIECPGYAPTTDGAKKCLKIIQEYEAAQKNGNRPAKVLHYTPDYIAGLGTAERLAFKDVIYHPRQLDAECANNNSTVKMFRSGSFNVLSLGDVECPNISAKLRNCTYLRRETDVMILAHHGADNGFTNKKLLKHLNPAVAICASNHANQHDHPKPEIRELLDECDIPLMTTKRGDVVLESIGNHDGTVLATNWQAGTTEIADQIEFSSKKAKLLSYNLDTIRQLYNPRPNYRSLGR